MCLSMLRAAALALAADFDQSNVDVAGADRAKVVFPIMLDAWHFELRVYTLAS